MVVLRFQKFKRCEHPGNSDPQRRIGNVFSRADPEVIVDSDYVQRHSCVLPTFARSQSQMESRSQ